MRSGDLLLPGASLSVLLEVTVIVKTCQEWLLPPAALAQDPPAWLLASQPGAQVPEASAQAGGCSCCFPGCRFSQP